MTTIDNYISTHTQHSVNTVVNKEEWTLTAEVTQPMRVYVRGPGYTGTGRVCGIPSSENGLALFDFTVAPPSDVKAALSAAYLNHLIAVGWCK